MSPQEYLCSLLSRRGYPTKQYDTLNSGYHNDSTPLQEASYTTYIVALVRDGKRKQLRKILDYGIHPNPSNYYGESLIHLVCRLGSFELLNIMLDCGSSVQVCDDYGRTPLHDACWSNQVSMDVVTLLLKKDRHLLFMADCRDTVPLQYVPKQSWAIWREYIDTIIEEIFPVRSRPQSIVEHADEGAVLARMRPNTRPLVCRSNALRMELARIVATGRMEPEEIDVIRGTTTCGVSSCSESCDTSDSDDDTVDTDEQMHDHSDNSSDVYYDETQRKEDKENDDDVDQSNDEVTTDDSDISDYSDDEQDDTETEFPLPNKFRSCNDSVGTGSWREDEMYMDEDDFEEMLERIATAKKKAKTSGVTSLSDYQ
jgi:ankyrin repeat protein